MELLPLTGLETLARILVVIKKRMPRQYSDEACVLIEISRLFFEDYFQVLQTIFEVRCELLFHIHKKHH